MDYEILALDQQLAMIQTRLAQLEQEHFGHVVSRRLLAHSGDDSGTAKAALAELDDTLAVIETAIRNLKAFSDELQQGA